jgi:hypothetical protein
MAFMGSALCFTICVLYVNSHQIPGCTC